MSAPHRVAGLAFWAGVVVLAFALVLLVQASLTPPTGFQDLAAVVGSMFLVAVSGLAFGTSLWVAQRVGRPYPPGWRLGVATGATVLAAVAALAFGDAARHGPQWHLLAPALALLALCARGLWSAVQMFRGHAPRRA